MLDVAFACERTVTANEPRKVACTHTDTCEYTVHSTQYVN